MKNIMKHSDKKVKLMTSLLTSLGMFHKIFMFQLCFRFVSGFCVRVFQHMADVTVDVTSVGVVAFKKMF
jgi:hypothetical protein